MWNWLPCNPRRCEWATLFYPLKQMFVLLTYHWDTSLLKICFYKVWAHFVGEKKGWPTQGKLEWKWGGLQICVVPSSCRVLSNTASSRLSCQRAKDGDVLMHACQKITAQLFSAKSHTGMAGEKPNETQKLRRRKRERGSNKHRSVTESLFFFQTCLWDVKKRFSQKSLNWKQTSEQELNGVWLMLLDLFSKPSNNNIWNIIRAG